jgi:hypothetical protein
MPQGNDFGAGDGVNILGYLQNIAARRQDDDVSLRLDPRNLSLRNIRKDRKLPCCPESRGRVDVPGV